MYRNRMKRLLIPALILISMPILLNFSRDLYDSGRSLYSQIRLFSMILERIRADYVDEKPSEELIQNAIDGMVSNLDPHTTYLTPDQFKQWNQNFEGYSGIGITFDIIKDKITIMSVFQGGPSDQIGLTQGDRIIAIDGVSAVGIKRDEVPLKLMGPKNTKVRVTIERHSWENPKEFNITRNEVHLQSVPYAFILKPGIGYIRIVRFSSTTGDEIHEALQSLKIKKIKQLVLDLRGNGGGYLEAAVEVSDAFLPGGKRIVYTKGRIENSFREYFTTDQNTFQMIPVIVLIDRGSASASEILAGALQDWDRAVLVGETSFGKGLVQSQYTFTDGSALLMTTAKYYTPTGRLIQRPYSDKPFEEYYSEILDDSVRTDQENDKSRPVYKTLLLQREVLGGGGITPDIHFKTRSDTIPQIVRNLYFSENRLFFTFVENYIKNNKNAFDMDVNTFLLEYTPNNGLLKSFYNYIRESGFKMTDEDFIKYQKDIRLALKQTIADKVWNDETRYKVQLMEDKPLLESLNYFRQAETLLKNAYN